MTLTKASHKPNLPRCTTEQRLSRRITGKLSFSHKPDPTNGLHSKYVTRPFHDKDGIHSAVLLTVLTFERCSGIDVISLVDHFHSSLAHSTFRAAAAFGQPHNPHLPRSRVLPDLGDFHRTYYYSCSKGKSADWDTNAPILWFSESLLQCSDIRPGPGALEETYRYGDQGGANPCQKCLLKHESGQLQFSP